MTGVEGGNDVRAGVIGIAMKLCLCFLVVLLMSGTVLQLQSV